VAAAAFWRTPAVPVLFRAYCCQLLASHSRLKRGHSLLYTNCIFAKKKREEFLLCFDKKICQKVFVVLIIVITIILNAEDTVLTSIFKKVN
jgi:hypothetical protein